MRPEKESVACGNFSKFPPEQENGAAGVIFLTTGTPESGRTSGDRHAKFPLLRFRHCARHHRNPDVSRPAAVKTGPVPSETADNRQRCDCLFNGMSGLNAQDQDLRLLRQPGDQEGPYLRISLRCPPDGESRPRPVGGFRFLRRLILRPPRAHLRSEKVKVKAGT